MSLIYGTDPLADGSWLKDLLRFRLGAAGNHQLNCGVRIDPMGTVGLEMTTVSMPIGFSLRMKSDRRYYDLVFVLQRGAKENEETTEFEDCR